MGERKLASVDEFYQLVLQMRRAQKRFFKNRSLREELRESIRLANLVDKALEEWSRNH